MDRIPDPYRELGILRGATDAQVKAAHRRLAKRFHPDGPEGDHVRFLAIQEAYSLLSDPLRRRDWDAQHTSGPMRAGEPGRSRGGRPPAARPARGTGGEGVRRDGSRGSAGASGAGAGPAGSARTGAGSAGSAAGSAAGTAGSGRRSAGARSRGTADAHHAAGAAGDAEHPGGPWSASDRDPSARSTTWSAAGVPWWEDFSPRDQGAGTAGAGSAGHAAGSRGAAGAGPSGRGGATVSPKGTAPGGTGTSDGGGEGRTTVQRSPEDVDVYSRSSGAAWSMAARRYFRKGEAELPKGGTWTYRGTQVVTGAEARKVAAETEAERRRAAEEKVERRRAAEQVLRSRAPAEAAPRTAFGHDEDGAGGSRTGAAAPPPGSEARPASSRPSTETARRQATPAAPLDAGVVGAEGSFLRRVRKVLGLGG